MLSTKPHSKFWFYLFAFSLALSWILPNHALPWRSFHKDLWILMWLICASIWILFASEDPLVLTKSSLVIITSSLIPIFQYKFNLIATFGQAVISSGYVLACGTALFIAQQPLQKNNYYLVHCLFIGIGVACVLCFSIQTAQWLSIYDDNLLTIIGFFILPIANGDRPSANLLQPNLLATLFIWGVIAGFWGYLHKVFHHILLIPYLMCISFGLALTQSRIGIVELFVLTAVMWFWRKHLPGKKCFYVCVALTCQTVLLYFFLPTLSTHLNNLDTSRNYASLFQDNVRITAYQIFFDAIWQRPWFGYGMSNLNNAYLELASTQIDQSLNFNHSHNLVLDLTLWLGVPLGTLFIGGFIYWLRLAITSVADVRQATLLAAVVSFAMHTIVELPHQYAIYLVPLFIFVGSIKTCDINKSTCKITRNVALFVTASLAVVILTTARDYLRYEEYYSAWLFERQKIGRLTKAAQPRLLVLHQLDNVMTLQRMLPQPNETQENLKWMHFAVRGEPSQVAYFNYVVAMALNGNRDEAVLWMHKINVTYDANDIKVIYKAWAANQKKYPQIADLKWVKKR